MYKARFPLAKKTQIFCQKNFCQKKFGCQFPHSFARHIYHSRSKHKEVNMKLSRRKALLLILARHQIKRKRKEALEKEKRRFWVRRLFAERQTKGEFHTLIADMKLFDHEYFQKQFRMLPTKLEELLGWIAPRIIKNSEKRQTIGQEERLCVTLRYLVTGDAQVTIGNSYRISPMGRIITETITYLRCAARTRLFESSIHTAKMA